jgi:hypothetical protein
MRAAGVVIGCGRVFSGFVDSLTSVVHWSAIDYFMFQYDRASITHIPSFFD